jgi:hypothetical protein
MRERQKREGEAEERDKLRGEKRGDVIGEGKEGIGLKG